LQSGSFSFGFTGVGYLIGGSGNDSFNFNGGTLSAALDGGPGINSLTATSSGTFVLGDNILTFGGVTIPMANIQQAQLNSTGNSTFDLTNWSGNASLAGGGSIDTLIAGGDYGSYILTLDSLGRGAYNASP